MSVAANPDSERLAMVRQRHGDASIEWSLQVDGRQHEKLMAVLVPNTDALCVARLTEDCGWQDQAFLTHAYSDMAFLLRLLSTSFRTIRELRAAIDDKKPPNYAAECGMTCKEPAFRVFLEERHGLERPLTDERITARVHSVLAISSRRQLNEDQGAADRWKSLKADFEAWRRHG